MTTGGRDTADAKGVDIVIPVYNAADDLARCVESVLAHTTGDFRLVLIDDASPDAAVPALFSRLERRGLAQLVLLRNPANFGFTGTANRGMCLGASERRDVVLLNSDTVVTRGWLTAILRCAASNPHIGTITPFSNNAEICSFPRFVEDNPWPAGADPELVRAALEAAAVPTYPELPTGVGFCMFIRRELIDGIGVFDEQAFGRGYGEENDFCLRGFRAGWRNVLCEDAFVLHLGARSFASDKQALAARNLRVLQARYPHYERMVADYIASDPLRPIRDAARLHLRLHDSRVAGVLHVVHGHGGGTECHARALIDASRDRYRHHLAVVVGSCWQIEEHLDDGAVRRFEFRRVADESFEAFLGGVLATFRIGLVHLHNVSGCREGLAEALQGLRVPYGYTVHDLSFACPVITMTGRGGRYCGAEQRASVCSDCLRALPKFAAVDIEDWRASHARLVAGAGFVIAPSRWAASTFARYFPAKVDVIPHAHLGTWARQVEHETGDRRRSGPVMGVLLPDDDVPVVGLLGAIGPDKGARRIEAMVDAARVTAARLRFVVIGYLDVQRAPWQSEDALLTVHGRYEAADLPRLLDHYRVDLVAYPSAGPETFCYTLSEAWAAGRPVVVPPIGALAERVAAHGGGWVLDEADWNDDARMLARITALVTDRVALGEAGAIARGVRSISAEEALAQTLSHYSRVAVRVPAGVAGFAPQRVRDAAGYRLWWPPEGFDYPEPLRRCFDGMLSGAVATAETQLPASGIRQLRPIRAIARILPAPIRMALRSRWR